MAIFKPPIGAKWWADLGSEGMPLTVAVNELIANSIDSWIENPPTRGSRKKLTIHVEISTNYVLVADDASGMNGLTLQEAMGPSKADKSSSDFADDLMGMYGLGLKSATANIGGHFEILTKEQNQNVNHLVMPIQLMKEQDEFLGDIEEGSYNEKTELKNNLTKKFEEKYLQKSGTVVVITKLKNPTIRADKKTHQSLSLAWKYFLEKNKFGKEVDIFLNGEKIEKPQLGYPLIIVPNTKVNFQIPVSFKEKVGTTSVPRDEMVTGSVWINNKGGQYDSGGLSIYRKMQLLLKNDQDLGSWWSNESATIEGFIQSDYLTPNSRKDGLDKEQPAYDAIDKVMKKFIPAKLVNSKDGGINGGGFKRTTYLDKDDLENALITQFLIEEWYPYFREFENKNEGVVIEFENEVKEYKIITPNPDPDPDPDPDPGPDTGPDPDPGPEKPKPTSRLAYISNTSFKLDGEVIEVIYLLDSCDGSFYAWKNISEGIAINIDPDFNNENSKYKKTLEKIVENKRLTPSEEIVKVLMTIQVIEEYLLNVGIDETIVIKFSKEWLKIAMNDNA